MKRHLGHQIGLRLADALEEDARKQTTVTDIERWRKDPVLFAKEALGIELWSRQAEFVLAITTNPRIAVRSGHKIGKSIGVAVAAIWWCACSIGDRVILTSTTGHQIRNILWKEVRRLAELSKRVGRIQLPTPALMPANGMKWEDGREIIGFSTDTKEGFAGLSGANLLFIVDEASGVPEWAFEVIRGNLAGGGCLVMISNPTQTSGSFFDAFHSDAERWRRIHISSEETPNAQSGKMLVPGLATREWVDDWAKLGTDSPSYRVRVRGEFPTGGDDTVIPLDVWNAAVERWKASEGMKGRLEIGVDPSRFGDDDAAIVPRRGKRVIEIETHNGLDGIQLAGKVMAVVRRHRRQGEPVAVVKVDVIGVGASCFDQLRQFASGPNREIELVAVNVSENATVVGKDGSELYHRLRDQLWFGLRDWLQDGGEVPADAQLETDCVSARYSFDLKSRYVVESKDEMKKRLKGNRSPDRADGLCLAVYEAPRCAPPRRLDVGEMRFGGERGF